MWARGLTGGREALHVADGSKENAAKEAALARRSWQLRGNQQIPAYDCDDWLADGHVIGKDSALLHRFPIEEIHQCHRHLQLAGRAAFDLIVCSWTMRHVCDPLGTLEALSELLAPGGTLLANQLYAPVLSANSAGGTATSTDSQSRSASVQRLRKTLESGNSLDFAVDVSVQGEEPRYGEQELKGGFDICVKIKRYQTSGPGVGVQFSAQHTGRVTGPLGAVLRSGGQYLMAEYVMTAAASPHRVRGAAA